MSTIAGGVSSSSMAGRTDRFHEKQPVPQGQGQTLFADSTAAYAELPDAMKARIEDLEGVHVLPGMGRSDKAVREGEAPKPLAAHQQPQRQPLVRVHPVTGTKSLYLCGGGQMDFITGPIAGMEPGPNGDGAALLFELHHHLTERRFTYTTNGRRAISSSTTTATSSTPVPGTTPARTFASCGEPRCAGIRIRPTRTRAVAGYRPRTSSRAESGAAALRLRPPRHAFVVLPAARERAGRRPGGSDERDTGGVSAGLRRRGHVHRLRPVRRALRRHPRREMPDDPGRPLGRHP